jgi:hypothetical protein
MDRRAKGGQMHVKVRRSELQQRAEDLVNSFMTATAEEDPSLADSLSALDDSGRLELAGVLGRFERSNLSPAQRRLMSRRILGRLSKPTAEGLRLVNQALDYLDLNGDALLDDQEMKLVLELIDWYGRAGRNNGSLSAKTLEQLIDMVKAHDRNHDRVLDRDERRRLHDLLRNHRPPRAV